MEHDVNFKLQVGDETVECSPMNTSLFMFIGDLASRNHLFIAGEREPDDGLLGTYVFDPGRRGLPALVNHMVTSGFIVHFNLSAVADCDEDAYQKYINQIVEGDVVPDFPPDVV